MVRIKAPTGRRAAPGGATLTVLSALLVVGVTAGCQAAGPGGLAEAPSAPPGPAGSAAAAPVGRQQPVGVERVIDGDTLLLTGGERVRVLGIDSCEASTPQGPTATAGARDFVGDRWVVLGVEPGVERDRFGRLLRYVSVPGRGDLGEFMVGFPHTGVYQGRGDASPAYRAKLAARDDGRVCA